MTINRCKYWIALFIITLAFSSCHQQKEMANDNKKTDSIVVHKMLPGSLSMSPGTFSAVAEVITVTKQKDSIAQQEFYKATVLIHAITGRGSSLTEIVAADDTINCSWPAYHADDKQLTENIANKKLMEAVIAEMPGRGTESMAFIIQFYRFK